MGEPLKIALVGSAPSSIRGAPYMDPSWHVWGCSPGAYGVVPRGRSNIWWELHRYEPGQTWFSPEYCQFLRDHPCVVVAELRKEIPNGMMLDYERLVRVWSPYFFTSSLAWMMVHAIEKCIETGVPGQCKIGLWGVDMAANEEYEAQRAGLHHFALEAQKLGIEVGVPAESDLFRPRFLYGIDEIKHFHVKLRARRQELEARLQAAQQVVAQKTDECAFLRGALDDLNYCFQTWPDKGNYLAPPVVDVATMVPASDDPQLLAAGGVSFPSEQPAPPHKGNGADGPPLPLPTPQIAPARLGPGYLP